MPTILALLGLSGVLLLALVGCVAQPPPAAVIVHEAGYLPAYPSYSLPPPGALVLRQGQRAVCE